MGNEVIVEKGKTEVCVCTGGSRLSRIFGNMEICPAYQYYIQGKKKKKNILAKNLG